MQNRKRVSAGARKKNWHTPSRSVFFLWIVPLALSLISTLASGMTALLGSVTTPVNPPEAVVCAYSSAEEHKHSRRTGRSKRRNFNRIAAPHDSDRGYHSLLRVLRGLSTTHNSCRLGISR